MSTTDEPGPQSEEAMYHAYYREAETHAVTLLVQTHDYSEALYAAYQFCAHQHDVAQDRTEADSAGWAAVDLFANRLAMTLPCDVTIPCYGYLVGVSRRFPVGDSELDTDIRALLSDQMPKVYGRAADDLIINIIRYVQSVETS